MKTIEKGMYVRTTSGIGKVEQGRIILKNKIFRFSDDDIIGDPSFDIRDLIRVGDYINGEKVIRIYEKGECYDGSNYGLITKTIETENDEYETIPHDHLYTDYSIKSIVTKEQFEAMQYIVGE